MSNKFNTRIQNKYDTLANWNNSDFDLLSGEIAVATNSDYTRVKIGDGTKSFSEIADTFIPDTGVSAIVSSKADLSALTEHTLSSSAHVLASDRTKWNTVTSKANVSDLSNHINNTSNPHNVQASQLEITAGSGPTNVAAWIANADYFLGLLPSGNDILVMDHDDFVSRYMYGSPENVQEFKVHGKFGVGNEIRTYGEYSIANGYNNEANAAYSHIEGVNANTNSDDSYSYVYNGDSNAYYYSHGQGTFNINPVNGLSGFYIGDQNLSMILKNNIPSIDVPQPGTTSPKMDGTATVGTSTKYAREDHIHPKDSSKADLTALTSHTGDSTIHVTSSEKSTWNNKQNALTFDNAPTSGSSNPVKSSGIYTALSEKAKTTGDSRVTFAAQKFTEGGIDLSAKYALKTSLGEYLPLSGGIMSANAQVKFTTTDPNDVWLSVDGYGISSNYQGTTHKLLGPDPQYDGAFVPREYQGGSGHKGTITISDSQYPYISFKNFEFNVNYPGASDSWGDINVNHGYSLNGSTNYQDGQIWYRNKTYAFPDSSGQLALKTDIPTNLSSFAQDTSHRLVTDTEKTTWNGKYSKPSSGIPKTDLASAVQTSLNKADTALQSFTETDPVFTTWKNGQSINLGLASSFGSDSYFDVAVGFSTLASLQFGTAIGSLSKSTGQFANAFGANSNATANYSTQIGPGTNSNLSSLQFMDTTVVLSGRTGSDILQLPASGSTIPAWIKEHITKFPGTMLRDSFDYEYVPCYGTSNSALPDYYVSFAPDEYFGLIIQINWSTNQYTRTQYDLAQKLGDQNTPFAAKTFTEGGTALSTKYAQKSDLNSYVTTGTNQSISGQKTFSGSNTFTNDITINGSGYIDFSGTDTGIDFTGTNQYIWFEGSGQNYIEFYAPDAKINFFESGTESITFSDTKTLKDHLAQADHMPAIATSTSPTINVVAGTKIYKHTVTSSPISLGGIAQNWTDANHALEIELWLTVPNSGTTVVLPGSPTWEWLETPDLTTTVDNQVLYISIRKTSTKTFANLYHTGV